MFRNPNPIDSRACRSWQGRLEDCKIGRRYPSTKPIIPIESLPPDASNDINHVTATSKFPRLYPAAIAELPNMRCMHCIEERFISVHECPQARVCLVSCELWRFILGVWKKTLFWVYEKLGEEQEVNGGREGMEDSHGNDYLIVWRVLGHVIGGQHGEQNGYYVIFLPSSTPFILLSSKCLLNVSTMTSHEGYCLHSGWEWGSRTTWKCTFLT